MRILTREELHEIIDRHRISDLGVVVSDVVYKMRLAGDIALGKTFIRYFQDNSLMQDGYAAHVYYCFRGLVCNADSRPLSSEEVDVFLGIAKKFWNQDIDQFFRDRNALACSRHVVKLLDVAEYICSEVLMGRSPRSADSYWNAYVALFDAVNARRVLEGKVRLDKMRCRQVYDRIQSIKLSKNKKNDIHSYNLRGELKFLEAKIDALPV